MAALIRCCLRRQMLGGEQAQEVARKLLEHHAQVTRIFKEMYGDVRSVSPMKQCPEKEQ